MRKRALGAALVSAWACLMGTAGAGEPWSKEKANAWYREQPWLVGSNYIPSTAINQLEMWQADTFDLATIDRELGWAEGLGFNTMRVFLHDIPWREDREGFLKRIDQFLEVAAKHKIRVMLVIFDSVWDPYPKAGKQRDPKPHVHNSGWVQSPGRIILEDPARHDELEGYVKGVVGHFREDPRIVIWDLFNEPDNPNTSAYGSVEFAEKPARALELLKKTYAWAREAGPTQPLTSGVWTGNDWSNSEKLQPMWRFQLEQSDINSYHDYSPLPRHKERVESLKGYGRPLVCTEYMARGNGSKFDPDMAYLKAEKIGAYNWGFIAGKSQTNYPWDSWKKQYTAEPELWFHDIFRANGDPYRQEEVDYIRGITGHQAK